MKHKIYALALVAFVLFGAKQAIGCTNFIITKGASKDGSTMITYAADSHVLYGALYHNEASNYTKGAMLQLVEWDTGRKLIQIPQVAHTYTTVGNTNEWGLAITETTYGGREECWDTTGGIDYGSLMYITLQRAKSAREAIKVIADFVAQYGYCSEGESLSISDENECWIMEIIGKGYQVLDKKGKADKRWSKGAVWVAMRVPDGYISGHANQARITTFMQEGQKGVGRKAISYKHIKNIFLPEVEVIYAEDVIAFARLKGWFDGKDADFSFSDTYAPLTFGAARGCEARVYAAFLRCNPAMKEYEDYAMGYNLKHRMPLWIKPEHKLSVQDVMALMRDHYEGTPMDMTKDVGAGPYKCPYRWRPMTWSYNGQEYVHERATSTQQTGFSLVAQSRSWMPQGAKGIIWFGVDDTYSTVYVPMYTNIKESPENFRDCNGSMNQYSETSAFWLFNQVSNTAYNRYCDMIVDIQKRQSSLENRFVKECQDLDNRLIALAKNNDVDGMRNTMTNFSKQKSAETFSTWKDLSHYLLVKYMDGNIKKEKDGKFIESKYRKGENVFPEQRPYPQEWYKVIVDDHGKTIAVPNK